jgi:nicotinate-nucleotide adenylyltransferase
VARLGLLGGTFNPPHLGHLVCAQEAWSQLGLDRVLLVPVHTPPHKEAQDDPGVEARVELCELAVAGDPRLGVSRVDADVPGASWTVDTLRRLHERHPEYALTFVVGGDMARSLPSWRDPEAILELAELGVAEREDVRRADVVEALVGLRGAAERVRFFSMPRFDVSSTLVRRRAAAGQPIRYLVPDRVAEAVQRTRMYR